MLGCFGGGGNSLSWNVNIFCITCSSVCRCATHCFLFFAVGKVQLGNGSVVLWLKLGEEVIVASHLNVSLRFESVTCDL